ncbi:MAG: hypothetical protein ACKO6B_13625, partial [Planctomycetia bacterium]
SKELALLYFAAAVAFLLAGSGRFGLDSLVRGRGRMKPLSNRRPDHCLERLEGFAAPTGASCGSRVV